MKSKYYIVLSLYGRRAVEIARQFQGNSCYRGIYEHRKRIGQLEVVIDLEGTYNGFENAWVDVLCLPQNIDKIFNQLRRIGFSECYALVGDVNENTGKQNDYNIFVRI